MRALRRPLNWALAAVYGLASVALLGVALHNAFYMVLSDHFQLGVLRLAPCGVVKSYVGYVLEDKDEAFRSAWEKAEILELLLEAEDRGVRLCYDPRLVLPYLGEAAGRYAIGEDEPLGRAAENLVLKRRDPALIKTAFDRYRAREPRVADRLCWRLETGRPVAPEYIAIRKAYCPPPEPPKPEPALTPEERRRKEAIRRILDESRQQAD